MIRLEMIVVAAMVGPEATAVVLTVALVIGLVKIHWEMILRRTEDG